MILPEMDPETKSFDPLDLVFHKTTIVRKINRKPKN